MIPSPTTGLAPGRADPGARSLPSTPQEIELKLDVEPAGIARLRRSPILTGTPSTRHRQTSVYFDTPDRALRRAGLSLRVRHIGKRRVQTIKVEGDGDAGLFARSEWEVAITGDLPVIDREAVPSIASIPDLSGLAPVFRVVVVRRRWVVEWDGATIELVIDRGRIRTDRGASTVCELELELKHGPPAALFALARALSAITPLQPGAASKWRRGYMRLDGSDDRPANAAVPHLVPGMTASRGFQAIAGTCIRQFRLNQTLLARRDDAEALHQARVALRRLRSAISVFNTLLHDGRRDHFHAELKWIAGALDRARDLDVLLEQTPKPSERDRVRSERERAYAAAGQAIASPRLNRLIFDLVEWVAIGDWLTRPAEPERIGRPLEILAAEALDLCRSQVRRHGRHWRGLDKQGRHRLRIKAKKLRYAAEFFQPLYGGRKAVRRSKIFLDRLESLQTLLGALNDRAAGARLRMELGLADGRLRHGHRKSLLSKAGHAFDALIGAKRFWHRNRKSKTESVRLPAPTGCPACREPRSGKLK